MKFLTCGSAAARRYLLVHGVDCGGEHSFQSAIRALEDNYHIVVLVEHDRATLYGEGYFIADGQFMQICQTGESVVL